MGSVIAGWILFIIGCAMYIVSIWKRVSNLITPIRSTEELALDDIKDTVDGIKKLLEVFEKFSEDIQFLLLGSGCILAGLFLLANKPF